MAIAVLSSSIGGNGGFRGHDVAAPSHVTTEDGGRRLGDDVMSPIPAVDQATGTQHSKKNHTYITDWKSVAMEFIIVKN